MPCLPPHELRFTLGQGKIEEPRDSIQNLMMITHHFHHHLTATASTNASRRVILKEPVFGHSRPETQTYT